MTKFADSLPEMCFTAHPSDPETFICLVRGEAGYKTTTVYSQEHADHLNKNLGVTKAQIAAMEAGSMFGWDVPGADPSRYDENGRYRAVRIEII